MYSAYKLNKQGDYYCFLSCLTVSLCFCIFSLLWLNLLSGTWRRPRRLELSYKWEADVGPGGWGSLSSGRRLRKLLSFSSQKSVWGRGGLWERGTDSWVAAEGEDPPPGSKGWHNSRTGHCRPSDLWTRSVSTARYSHASACVIMWFLRQWRGKICYYNVGIRKHV